MAPIGEQSADGTNIYGDSTEVEEDNNLWANILEEVQKGSSQKLPSSKSILVLGENESGKTSLLAKLQSNEDPKKGAGLEYHYIDVKDEERDDQTRLGVWILDGDRYHTSLLKFAVNEHSFTDSLILLVVSMANPWAIMDSLEKWSTVLQNHVDRLRIPSEKRQEYEENLVRHFQEYTEPDDKAASSSRPRSTATTEEEKVLLPLGESTLTNNIGIPIVVAVTKSDYISVLEKEHDYREEHFDFIQQHIRKFCLNFGAALFYMSVKEEKNCDLLLNYIKHRIYGFPFMSQAYVVDKDSVFIPAGWDNEKKISILYENMTSMKPDDSYDDIIIRPITKKPVQRDAEVVAEDEQLFLMKQQTQLSKAPAPGTRPAEGSPIGRPAVQKPAGSPRVAGTSPSATGAAGSPKGRGTQGMEPGKPGAPSEGVLANFFNSLLNKKPGQAGSPGVPGKPTDRQAMLLAAASVNKEAMARRGTSHEHSLNTKEVLARRGSLPIAELHRANLLSQRPSPQNPRTPSPNRASVSRDAAAELDRIRTKKTTLPAQSQNSHVNSSS